MPQDGQRMEFEAREARRLAESIAYRRATIFNLAVGVPLALASATATLLATTSLMTGGLAEGMRLMPEVLNNDGNLGWRVGACVALISAMSAFMPFKNRLYNLATMAVAAAVSATMLYPGLTQATLDAPTTATLSEADYNKVMCERAGIGPDQHALLIVNVDGQKHSNYDNIECGTRREIAVNRPAVLPGLTAPNGQPAQHMRVTP